MADGIFPGDLVRCDWWGGITLWSDLPGPLGRRLISGGSVFSSQLCLVLSVVGVRAGFVLVLTSEGRMGWSNKNFWSVAAPAIVSPGAPSRATLPGPAQRAAVGDEGLNQRFTGDSQDEGDAIVWWNGTRVPYGNLTLNRDGSVGQVHRDDVDRHHDEVTGFYHVVSPL